MRNRVLDMVTLMSITVYLVSVNEGVCGSYNGGPACDNAGGSNYTVTADDDDGERSPGKRSQGRWKNAVITGILHPLSLSFVSDLFSFISVCFNHFSAVPPRSVQSPLIAGQATGILPLGVEGTEQDQSLKRLNGVSCVSSGQTRICSSSPVRGDVSTPLDEVALSPVKRHCGVPTLMTSPVFGCTSPGKRSNRSSPLTEGGHSPARLSPRSKSPLTGKLLTLSPVQRKACRYSPVRNSKSWLGFQRAPSPKMEGEEVRTVKSLSVPDLIVYLDESRLGFNLCPFLCFRHDLWVILILTFQGSCGKG